MELRLNRLIAAVALIGGLAVPAAALAAFSHATSDVNMRTGPGTHFQIITTVPAGARVNVLGCEGTWCRSVYHLWNGWVSSHYLTGFGFSIIVRPTIVVRPPYWNRPPRPNPWPKPKCKIAPGFPCK